MEVTGIAGWILAGLLYVPMNTYLVMIGVIYGVVGILGATYLLQKKRTRTAVD